MQFHDGSITEHSRVSKMAETLRNNASATSNPQGRRCRPCTAEILWAVGMMSSTAVPAVSSFATPISQGGPAMATRRPMSARSGHTRRNFPLDLADGAAQGAGEAASPWNAHHVAGHRPFDSAQAAVDQISIKRPARDSRPISARADSRDASAPIAFAESGYASPINRRGAPPKLDECTPWGEPWELPDGFVQKQGPAAILAEGRNPTMPTTATATNTTTTATAKATATEIATARNSTADHVKEHDLVQQCSSHPSQQRLRLGVPGTKLQDRKKKIRLHAEFQSSQAAARTLDRSSAKKRTEDSKIKQLLRLQSQFLCDNRGRRLSVIAAAERERERERKHESILLIAKKFASPA
eukprot:TRINITY_DN8563_c1_g1_i1.p1 TRINITY_DN8563_c1_g1~~TRINITY_DN8563_c1_g1_i1.p1  ORF type:complete len:355 (+),score=65.33 TRINITY_DN8563_c1_g1_i1:11-1075(+)